MGEMPRIVRLQCSVAGDAELLLGSLGVNFDEAGMERLGLGIEWFYPNSSYVLQGQPPPKAGKSGSNSAQSCLKQPETVFTYGGNANTATA